MFPVKLGWADMVRSKTSKRKRLLGELRKAVSIAANEASDRVCCGVASELNRRGFEFVASPDEWMFYIAPRSVDSLGFEFRVLPIVLWGRAGVALPTVPAGLDQSLETIFQRVGPQDVGSDRTVQYYLQDYLTRLVLPDFDKICSALNEIGHQMVRRSFEREEFFEGDVSSAHDVTYESRNVPGLWMKFHCQCYWGLVLS